MSISVHNLKRLNGCKWEYYYIKHFEGIKAEQCHFILSNIDYQYWSAFVFFEYSTVRFLL